MFWLWFLYSGNPRYVAFDWFYSHQMIESIRLALRHGTLPWHVAFAPEELIHGFWTGSSSLMAMPQCLFSPQAFLLLFVSTKAFIGIQTVGLYVLGLLGLRALMDEAELDDYAFILAALVFTAGGYFTAQMAAGSLMCVGFFLWPAVLLMAWRVLKSAQANDRAQWMHAALLALLTAAVIYQGSVHQYFHMLELIAVCAIVAPKAFRPFAVSFGLSVIASAGRLIPVWLASGYSSAVRVPGGGYGAYLHGVLPFWTPEAWLSSLAESLTVVNNAHYGAGSYWDLDVYVGLFGLLVIVVGLVWALREDSDRWLRGPYGRLMAVGAVLLAMSMGPIYLAVFRAVRLILPVPVFDRVPSRLIIVPLLLILLPATHGLSGLTVGVVPKWRTLLRWLVPIVLASSLLSHSIVWRVAATESVWRPSDRVVQLTMRASLLDLPVSPLYRNSVFFGSLLGLCGMAACVAIVLLVRRRERSVSHGSAGEAGTSPPKPV